MSKIDYAALGAKMTAGYAELSKLLTEKKIDLEEYQKRAKQIQADYQAALLGASTKKTATLTATYDKEHFKLHVKYSIPTDVVGTLSKDDYFGVYLAEEKDIGASVARVQLADLNTRENAEIDIPLTNTRVTDKHKHVVKYINSGMYKELANSDEITIDVPAGAQLAGEEKDPELLDIEKQFRAHKITEEDYNFKIKQWNEKHDPTGSRAKALKTLYSAQMPVCAGFKPTAGNENVCSVCHHGKATHAAATAAGTATVATEAKSSTIDDKLLEELVVKDLAAHKGMLIYAGAGVSMSAPSCSPSWWRLMNEVLQVTFGAVPDKFKSKNLGGDLTRQPEEIMESYYYLIRDRLFSLFRLLEAGAPNANHIAMAKLAKVGKVKAILTTNFDIFIERALKQEHVPFKTVVTAEEFEDYLRHGCKEFAVLKIHGTIERPNTIVAVANHYKMGKGFSGAKADVLAYFIAHYPTLFLGYSGWDFEHANYQAFWKRVGEEKGKDVFWLTLKGFSGGPDLDRILGTHIGKRLHIGAGALPEFGSMLLTHYSKPDAEAVITFNKSIDGEKVFKEIEQKRGVFLKEWVHELPKTATLSFLLLEAQRLNQGMQDVIKKNKSMKDENETGTDSVEFSGSMQEWAMQMATGKLTKAEFDLRVLSSSTDTMFKLVAMPRARKTELKKKVIAAVDGNALWTKQYGFFRSMWPTLCFQFASKCDLDKDSDEDIMKRAMDWINELDAIPEDTPINKMRRKVKQSCITGLGYKGEEAKNFPIWMEEVAQKAVAEGLDDQTKLPNMLKLNEYTSAVAVKISDTVMGSVDVEAIAAYCVDQLNHVPEKNVQEYLENASMLAISIMRQADHRAQKVRMNRHYIDVIQTKTVGNWDQEISDADMHSCEGIQEVFKPVLERLHKMSKAHQTAKGESSPDEIIAAFDLSTAYLWLELSKYNQKYQEEKHREHEGHYPKDSVPPYAAKYIKKIIVAARPHVHDDRIAQPLYALMAIIGESMKDYTMIKDATEASLKLTQGKVTELTPYPIPEALAVYYVENGKDDEALKWFELSLVGIKTCVSRLKCDAIVLLACDLQAKKNPTMALKWAFTYSAKFVPSQDYLLPGPGRDILYRKCGEWAHKLGFADVKAAQAKLMSSEH